jgi:hypothetical protein
MIPVRRSLQEQQHQATASLANYCSGAHTWGLSNPDANDLLFSMALWGAEAERTLWSFRRELPSQSIGLRNERAAVLTFTNKVAWKSGSRPVKPDTPSILTTLNFKAIARLAAEGLLVEFADAAIVIAGGEVIDTPEEVDQTNFETN